MTNLKLFIILSLFASQAKALTKMDLCLQGYDVNSLCTYSIICGFIFGPGLCPNKCGTCPSIPKTSDDDKMKLCVSGKDDNTDFCPLSSSTICGKEDLSKLCPNKCNNCPKPSNGAKLVMCYNMKDQESKYCEMPDICNSDFKDFCPNKCNTCRTLAHYAKTNMTKVSCKDWILDGQVQAACWEANYNNQNGKDTVYFYPDKKTTGGFKGYVMHDGDAKFYAVGDVTDPSSKLFFRISSDKADDSGAEVNSDSGRFPLVAELYNSQGSDFSTRDTDSEVPLNGRAALPRAGYKLTVQPVMDQRFQDHHQANSSTRATAIANSALAAFVHSSAKVKFEITLKTPIPYNQSISADRSGYDNLTTSMGGDAFDFSSLASDVNMVLVFTRVPDSVLISLVLAQSLSLEFAIRGGVCNATKNQRVAIMEDFGTDQISSETAIRGIGDVLGYGRDYADTQGYIPITRNSSTGVNCTGMFGFMDIPVGSKLWTECSNEDITRAVTNDKLTCLTEIQCGEDKSDLCPAMVKNIPSACMTSWVKSSCGQSCDSSSTCSSSALRNPVLPASGCFADSCPGNDTTTMSPTTVANATPGGGVATPGNATASGSGATSGNATSGGSGATPGNATSGGSGATPGNATSGGSGATSGNATAGGSGATTGSATSGGSGATSSNATSGGSGNTATCQPCTPPTTTTANMRDPNADCLSACSEMKRRLKCSYADVGECCRYSCRPPTKNPSNNEPVFNPDAGAGEDKISVSQCEYYKDNNWCDIQGVRPNCLKTCGPAK